MSRVALITGASRGIGRQIVISLAEKGYSCVITAKTVEPNPKLPGTIYDVHEEVRRRFGTKTLPMKLDVRDIDQMKLVVDTTIDHFGKIDCVIHNAGALYWDTIENTSFKQYNLIHDINSRAAFTLSSLCLPYMVKQNYGHIIMHSPPLPQPTDIDIYNSKTAYMMSKWGMTMTAMGIASEYRGRGIAANTIWPNTAIESYATINNNLGNPSHWRKPNIIADAIIGILDEDPCTHTGNQWIDEDYLRSKGVNDFSKYQCVPGKEPMTLDQAFRLMNA